MAHRLFVAEYGLSLVAVRGRCSLVASCGLLVAVASLVAEHGLSACGTGAWLLHGM